MKVLVLWADPISPNLGVRVLAAGAAALAARAWTDVEVTYHNFGAATAPVKVGRMKSAFRERVTGRGGLIPWLRGFDVVLDTRSGDSFADIYGLSRLTVMSLMADAVSRAGVPLVMAPQTLGPFEHRRGRMLARRSLGQASFIMARDAASAEAAARLGHPADVVTTDVVFALPVPEVARCRDVLFNVSGLLWSGNEHVPAADYRSLVRAVIGELVRENRQVTLFAHVLDSPDRDNDVPAMRQLQQELDVPVELLIPDSLDAARRAVASAEIVLGSRMHACLNSLSVGTPAVPLAYSRKFDPLLSRLGWPYTIDLRDPGTTVTDVMTAVEQAGADDPRRSVLPQARELIDAATQALRLRIPPEGSPTGRSV